MPLGDDRGVPKRGPRRVHGHGGAAACALRLLRSSRRRPRPPGQAGVVVSGPLASRIGGCVAEPELRPPVGGQVGEPGELLGPRVRPGLEALGPLEQPLGAGGEAFGAEQGRQQPSALGRRRPERLLELALREHDDLLELLGCEPQQRPEEVADLLHAVGHRRPALALAAAEDRMRPLRRHAGAPFLLPLVGRGSRHQPVLTPDRELEGDRRLGRRRRGVVAAQVVGRAGSRHRAVQRVAHGVDERRLAGTRLAVDEEEAGLGHPVELDHLGPGKRPEGPQLQAAGPQRSPSTPAKAVTRSASSAGPAGSPVTCSTKSSISSRSERLRSRSV